MILAGNCLAGQSGAFSLEAVQAKFHKVRMNKRKSLHIPRRSASLALVLVGLATTALVAEDNPFLGNWALTIPGGGAGWLGITKAKDYYDATILWGGGSVVPVSSVFFDDSGNTLYVTRVHEVKRKDANGKVVRTHQFTDLIMGKVSGDELSLTLLQPRENGEGMQSDEFTGKRIPPIPAKPDLSAVKFGEPIRIFNGENLDGWRLTDPNQANGWSVKDGILINNPVQPEGKHLSFGNLRTDKEFEDFNLTLETRVPKEGNSGIYLRGIYEVQVSDSFGRRLDPHNMGAIYSRITPTSSAEKPAGEWQSFDITLADRHVTVILNGTKIIDNQPLEGCTGGALWSDQFRPGPIYLQGDHKAVDYRNIVLRPVVK